MWWADRQGSRQKDLGNVSSSDSLVIGSAQALALDHVQLKQDLTTLARLLAAQLGRELLESGRHAMIVDALENDPCNDLNASSATSASAASTSRLCCSRTIPKTT